MKDIKNLYKRTLLYVITIVVFGNGTLFISCKENLTASNVALADLANCKTLSDAGIIDSADIISLQGTDLWIQKIDKIVEYDSLLYIMDQKSKALHIFSRNGQHISTICNVGHATNEYIGIDDFFIDHQDGTINILSSLDKTVFKYNADGSKLLSTKPVPMSFRRLIDYSNGYIGFMGNCSEGENAPHNFWIMDKNFQILKSYIDINPGLEGVFHGDIATFAKHSDKLYFFSDASRDVYSIRNDKTNPVLEYTLDCGEANPPKLTESDYANWQRMLEVSNKYVMNIYHFQETDANVIFHYLYQGCYYLTIQNKSNAESQTIKLDVYDGDYFFEFGRIIAITDDIIYSSVEAQSVYYPWKGEIGDMNYEQEYPRQVNNLRRKLQKVDPEGNPFVVKYYINKRLS